VHTTFPRLARRRCARQDSNLRPSVRSQPRSAPIDLRRAPRPSVKRIFLVRSEVQSAGTAANPPVVVVRELVNIGADSAIVQAGVQELGGTYFSSSTLFFLLMAPRHQDTLPSKFRRLNLRYSLCEDSDLTVIALLDNFFV
jgi:hypothetical protein